MLLDAIALAILALFAGLGAWLGAVAAACSFVSLIIGYAVSLLTPRRQHGLEGLTMFDIEQAISSMTGDYA